MDFVFWDVLNTAVTLNSIYQKEYTGKEKVQSRVQGGACVCLMVLHGLFCDLGQLIIFLDEEKYPI